MPNRQLQLRKIQKMLAEGFDIGSAPLAPFVAEEDERQGIIARVVEGMAVLESGEVIPVREIYNPDKISLEGAMYDHGKVRHATEQGDKNMKFPNRIKDK